MPKTIKYEGRSFKFFTKEEVDNGRKSPDTFVQVPDAVVTAHGLEGPLFYYVGGNPMGAPMIPWGDKATVTVEPQYSEEFLDIFTDGRGPLTNEEVRAQEALYGVSIDDTRARNAYNNKLAKDMSLFGGVLSTDEVAEMLEDSRDVGAFRRAVAWVTNIIGAAPVFFRFKSDQWISEDVFFVEGVRNVTLKEAAKVDTVGIAFPGPHCMKRDVFSLVEFLKGKPNLAAAGKKAVDLPGRDRWFRVIGTGALTSFIYNAVLTLTSVQVSQIQEGRDVTMPPSTRLPQDIPPTIFEASR